MTNQKCYDVVKQHYSHLMCVEIPDKDELKDISYDINGLKDCNAYFTDFDKTRKNIKNDVKNMSEIDDNYVKSNWEKYNDFHKDLSERVQVRKNMIDELKPYIKYKDRLSICQYNGLYVGLTIGSIYLITSCFVKTFANRLIITGGISAFVFHLMNK